MTFTPIVKSILAIGRELGLVVIAEGIESAEQEAILRRMGCREGQGYLYGKAMDPGAIARLVRQGLVTERTDDAA